MSSGNTRFGKGVTLIPQAAPPADPEIGDMYVSSLDGSFYYYNGSGWVIGSSNKSDYISPNGDANTVMAGWTTYADVAQATPVDGIGGSPNVTFDISTSEPLRGIGSFLFTKDAVNRQGQGFSYDFTINAADEGKVLTIDFDYAVASGAFADGDVTVWVYDIDYGVMTQPTPYRILNTLIKETWSGRFQTSVASGGANSRKYRLIFHVASTSTSAYSLKLDAISVGPQQVRYGAPITDWTDYVCTCGLTGGTTIVVAKGRRVGGNFEGLIEATFSTVFTGGTATFTLPPGLAIDTSKLAATTANQLGRAYLRDVGTDVYHGSVEYSSTTAVRVFALGDDAGPSSTIINNGNISTTTPFTWTNGDRIGLSFSVPIVGWSSNTVISSDADTRVVVAAVTGDAASASAANPIIFPSTTFDTHGGYNASTGRYTVPVSGYYRVHGYIEGASAGILIGVYKNAALAAYAGVTVASYNACAFSSTVSCIAGDILDIRPAGGSFDANASSRLFFERISGPTQIAASETVGCEYTKVGGNHTSSSNVQDITSLTLVKDTHGAMNATTGVFTAPVGGFYTISACLAWATSYSGNTGIYITKGASTLATSYPISAATGNGGNASMTTYLLAGETIKFHAYQISGGNLAYSSSSPTRISIIRNGI